MSANTLSNYKRAERVVTAITTEKGVALKRFCKHHR